METVLIPPPDREDAPRLEALSARALAEPAVRLLLESLPVPTLLLNRARQVVAGNRKALDAIRGTDLSEVLGLRPGEALSCVEAERGSDGCGTAPACLECGAARALAEVTADGRRAVVRECRITTGAEGLGALDFEAHVSALTVGDEELLLLSLLDISARKRREVLERVFFHDVLNTAGGVQGLAGALARSDSLSREERGELVEELHGAVSRLVEEIRQQRRLVAAERGELALEIAKLDAAGLLDGVRATYGRHEVAADRRIEVRAPAGIEIVSDRSLLIRSLGNLAKNALEAIGPGETVTLAAERDAGEVRFTVANPGTIPDSVRRQLFKRSFSTKRGEGRGIGTWSVRLFVEGYLEGRVAVESDPETGTRFSVVLPRRLHAPD